jgi:hypothetical protein
MAAALGGPVHPDVVALYADHDGMDEVGDLHWRLMPSSEAIATNAHGLDGTVGVHWFWTDDESNYVGIFADGPLAGKLRILDHDESDPAPVFRTVHAFYEAMFQAAALDRDWYEMPREYPILVPAATNLEHEDDLALALYFTAQYQAATDEEDRLRFAFCAMNLLPMEESARLIDVVWDEDMYIQARACELLGKKRYTPAIPDLVRVIHTGMPNGQTAAILALGRIGSPEAQVELLRLAERPAPGDIGLVSRALELCGYEVSHSGGRWSYRASGTQTWIQL